MGLEILRVATFALTREKNTKRVEMKPFMFTGKLLQPRNKVLRDFIAANLAMILNMPEEIPGTTGAKQPALYVQDLKRRSHRRAYILDFWKNEKRTVLRNGLTAPEIPFIDCAKTIAEWLKQLDFWPKTYLFIAQFTISEVEPPGAFLGILLTRLSHGKLAEHEDVILQQIEKGVIDPDVKKGHLFPHIIQQDNQITIEYKVKSFEDYPVPADYHYDFLDLDHPLYAQSVAEDTYDDFKGKKKKPSFAQLKQSMAQISPEVPNLAKATLELDNVEIKVPLHELDQTVKIGRDDHGFVVVAKGSNLKVKLGKDDLLADGVFRTKNTKEILDEIRQTNSNC